MQLINYEAKKIFTGLYEVHAHWEEGGYKHELFCDVAADNEDDAIGYAVGAISNLKSEGAFPGVTV